MRPTFTGILAALLAVCSLTSVSARQAVTNHVRYSMASVTAYGILEGDQIRELKGDLFASPAPTGRRSAGVGQTPAPVRSEKGHRRGPELQDAPWRAAGRGIPGLFAKYPTSIIAHGENIVIPPDAKNVHYEGELVIVIGKRAKSVDVKTAKSYVFGVTIGNDVSERDWQKQDLQWFRAKASGTFGPMGPAIVTGLNYDDLLLQTKLNGEVVQSQRTKDLIFDVATIVSYLSKYVTLEPGDVIFSGTPGTTRAFKPGDTIEVEIEGIGTLRNKAILGGS